MAVIPVENRFWRLISYIRFGKQGLLGET